MPRSKLKSKEGGILRARRYGRVSTEDQNREGKASIPDQDRITAAHVERRAWADLGFVHDEESGTSTDRKEWQTVLDECRRGEVDVIVCAKLDRFARDALSGLTQISDLHKMGVDVVACDVDFDSTTPMGKAMLQIVLVFAELERNTIIERMAKGQYGAARLGFWPSADSGAPFGLQAVASGSHKVLALNEDEAATIRQATVLMVDERRTLADAVGQLNALGLLPRKAARWSTEALRDCLADPARKGVVVWGKADAKIWRYGDPVAIPGVPAVLTEARWNAVQVALAVRKTGPKSASRTYPLSGRMASPHGDSYVGTMRSDLGLARYYCRGKKWKPGPEWVICSCRRLEAEAVEAAVWAEVTGLLVDPARLRLLSEQYLGVADSASSEVADLPGLERKIAKLRAGMSTAVATHIKAGTPADVVRSAMEELNGELDALERRRTDMQRWQEAGKEARKHLSSLDALAGRAAQRLDGASLATQAEVLELLGVRVQVTQDRPAIEVSITGTVRDVGSTPGPVQTWVPPGRVPLLPAAPFHLVGAA